MRVEIIDNINHFPQFEAQNVFQTKEYMRLFEHEKGTKVVLFAVYSDFSLLLIQPLTIIRYYRHLPSKFASYAVAWREPWRAQNITDEEAVRAFELMSEAIVKYCRKRALYVEYRHFLEGNIYHPLLISYKVLPWCNIYRKFSAAEVVEQWMNKSKRKQLRQSFDSGVEVELNPSDKDIKDWYALLRKLYYRIHRPLPSVDLFLKLNESGIGRVFVVKYQGRVLSGSAILYFQSKAENSQFSTLNSQLFYEWYRASIDDRIEGVYPSVVATWQAMQLVVDMGGGMFDFMGAGPRNKEYGVREFKLKFGGEITNEYRYRRLFI
jgi:hypothetical protein